MGDVGGWIASAVVGDGEVGPGEEVDLGVPALPAARVFVDEDDGKSLATGLVVEVLAVDIGFRHMSFSKGRVSVG